MFQLFYGGQQHGPYVLDQIKTMWASGIITADALYWNETDAAWQPVIELLSPAAQPPQPTPQETPKPAPPTIPAQTERVCTSSADSSTPTPQQQIEKTVFADLGYKAAKSEEDAGNYPAMRIQAEALVRRHPKSALAFKCLGDAFYHNGSPQEALTAINKALQITPDDVIAWCNLGTIRRKMEQLPEAEAAFKQALKFAPDDPFVLANLGRLWIKMELRAEGQQTTKEAEEILKENPFNDYHGEIREDWVWERIGKNYQHLNLTVEAASAFERADKLKMTAQEKSWDSTSPRPSARARRVIEFFVFGITLFYLTRSFGNVLVVFLCFAIMVGVFIFDAVSPGIAIPPAQEMPWNPITPRPWRRLWARFLDLFILGGIPLVIWLLIWCYFFPNSNIKFSAIIFAAVFESWLLSKHGTTPGKWLLGISVRESDGGKLTYDHAWKRAWSALWRSMPIWFPPFGLLAYRDLKTKGATKWDRKGNYVVSCSQISGERWFASASISLLLIVGAVTAVTLYVQAAAGGVQNASVALPASALSPKTQQVETQDATSNTHLVTDPDGKHHPAPGYDWLNPDDPKDLRVVLKSAPASANTATAATLPTASQTTQTLTRGQFVAAIRRLPSSQVLTGPLVDADGKSNPGFVTLWDLEIGEVFTFTRYVSREEWEEEADRDNAPEAKAITDNRYVIMNMGPMWLMVPATAVSAVLNKDIAAAALKYSTQIKKHEANCAKGQVQ